MQSSVEVIQDDIEPRRKMPVSTGRPTKMTKEVIQKLESAYLIGATDQQACLTAGISETALYAWQRKNPTFEVRKRMLQSSLALKAKASLDKHIPRDGKLALDVIERLEKDKWSLRTELTGSDGTPIAFTFAPPSNDQ